ncbi:MAG: hypothetical protein HKP43_06985 [Altererythrobacter sp.]|nr:hypothetical protein [Altererythrobacter sp.]NNK46351.1 hypothetical protein [Altererythrobacter sp.]
MSKLILCIAAAMLLGACDEAPRDMFEFERDLTKAYTTKLVGTSRAVALKKAGFGGVAWLATIHGYADNRSVCEELIEPYNQD